MSGLSGNKSAATSGVISVIICWLWEAGAQLVPGTGRSGSGSLPCWCAADAPDKINKDLE